MQGLLSVCQVGRPSTSALGKPGQDTCLLPVGPAILVNFAIPADAAGGGQGADCTVSHGA